MVGNMSWEETLKPQEAQRLAEIVVLHKSLKYERKLIYNRARMRIIRASHSDRPLKEE